MSAEVPRNRCYQNYVQNYPLIYCKGMWNVTASASFRLSDQVSFSSKGFKVINETDRDINLTGK